MAHWNDARKSVSLFIFHFLSYSLRLQIPIGQIRIKAIRMIGIAWRTNISSFITKLPILSWFRSDFSSFVFSQNDPIFRSQSEPWPTMMRDKGPLKARKINNAVPVQKRSKKKHRKMLEKWRTMKTFDFDSY